MPTDTRPTEAPWIIDGSQTTGAVVHRPESALLLGEYRLHLEDSGLAARTVRT